MSQIAAVYTGSQLDSETFIRLSCFPLLSLLATTWVYFLARPRQAGARRLLVSMPAVLPLLISATFALRPDDYLFVTIMSGVTTLSAWKIAAYALGRGPLLAYENAGFFKLLGVISLPIIPSDAFRLSKGRSLKLAQTASAWEFLCSYCSKSTYAALVAMACQTPGLPLYLQLWLLAHWLILVIGATWDFSSFLAVGMFGLKVAPSFDKPWLSTSYNDYWARRWNLTVSYMLRVLVYDPIMEGSLCPSAASQTRGVQRSDLASTSGTSSIASNPPAPAAATVTANITLVAKQQSPSKGEMSLSKEGAKPAEMALATDSTSAVSSTTLNKRPMEQAAKQPLASTDANKTFTPSSSTPASPKPSLLRRYLALQAVFALSGAWHALIFYNNTHVWSFRWFLFFTLQAPICTMEGALAKHCKAAGIKVPRLLAMVLTQGSLTWMSAHLFLGPFSTSGLEAKCMEPPNLARSYLAAALQQWLP